MQKLKQAKRIKQVYSLQNSKNSSPAPGNRRSNNVLKNKKELLKPINMMENCGKIVKPFFPTSTIAHPKSLERPAKTKTLTVQCQKSTIFHKQNPNKFRRNTEHGSIKQRLKTRQCSVLKTEQKYKVRTMNNSLVTKGSRVLNTRQETQLSPLNKLTEYEQNQAKIYEVFYVGARRIQDDDDFTDVNGDAIVEIGDAIMFRYEIIEELGSGAFGKVFKARDHKRNQFVALKIIKNHPKYQKQAKVQIKILEKAMQNDQNKKINIVQLKHAFLFRGHPCLSFQLLYLNLFQFCQQINFVGLSLSLIHRFSIQILQCLNFLQKNKIIHCDIKPENIMIRRQNKVGVKVIDFGGGCFDGEQIYNYIQSRYYRAPQIILGIQYGTAIDMWSFGCVAMELFTGHPIFTGQNQVDQLGLFIQVLGLPSKELLNRGTRSNQLFTDTGLLKVPKKSKQRIPKTRTIQKILKRCSDESFVDFVTKIVRWNPEQRMTAREALSHKWILAGIPEDLRIEHLKHI